MKSLIFLTLALSTAASHAALYNCKLNFETKTDKRTITFDFDTIKEPNRFVPIDESAKLYVGCIVFRSTNPMVSCVVGGNENFSVTATADEGSNVIGLDSTDQSRKYSLTCLNKTK